MALALQSVGVHCGLCAVGGPIESSTRREVAAGTNQATTEQPLSPLTTSHWGTCPELTVLRAPPATPRCECSCCNCWYFLTAVPSIRQFACSLFLPSAQPASSPFVGRDEVGSTAPSLLTLLLGQKSTVPFSARLYSVCISNRTTTPGSRLLRRNEDPREPQSRLVSSARPPCRDLQQVLVQQHVELAFPRQQLPQAPAPAPASTITPACAPSARWSL